MSSLKRKLALLLGASMAVAAFAAPSASAVTVVKDAATGEPCPAVSPAVEQTSSSIFTPSKKYESGGCTVHVVTNLGGAAQQRLGDYYSNNFCQSAFDMHVGPDGWGYVTNIVYNCAYYSVPCAGGDRVITPPEYNPPIFGGNLFKYSNANTDLHLAMCGTVSWGPTFSKGYQGMVSLDAGESEGAQIWTNQQTTKPAPTFYYLAEGAWRSSEGRVTITH